MYLCPLCGQVNVNFQNPEVHTFKQCPEPWKRLVSWGCHPVPLMTWAPFADLFTGPAGLEVRRELGAAGFVFETAEGWATLSSGPFSTLTGMEKVAAAAVFAHSPSRSKYFRCPVCRRVESLSPSAHRCTRGNTTVYASVVPHLRIRRPLLVGANLEGLGAGVKERLRAFLSLTPALVFRPDQKVVVPARELV